MKHTARGVVTAWLALIALQAVSTKGSSGRIASLMTDVNRLVARVLDPNVPAIPDLSGGTAASSTVITPTTPYSRPADMPVPAPSSDPTQLGVVGRTYAN